MSKFPTFKDNFSLPAAEEQVIAFWNEQKIFQSVTAAAKDRPPFVFYEGPPTANGRPGIHHVISRTVKDLICRYKAMQGYRVDRKGGWDTHGLPVEIEVEKQLGLDSKQKIVAYGVDKFNQKCRESVFKYLDDWNKITERMGYWLDLDGAYVTLTNDYIESVWSILANFHDRGLIYKGHKTVPYCPRCGTGLSSHEVALGYETVKDPSVFLKFKSADGSFNFLVWTTTPWTLPSNAALALKANAEYALVEVEGERYVLAAALVPKVFGADAAVKMIGTKPGAAYVGQKYQPLFPYHETEPNCFAVFAADFVTLEDGTGIVHIAPGYGADDYELGKANGLPVLQAVDATGHFRNQYAPYAGAFFKDADTPIIIDLKKAGRLLRKETVEHTYPFCWRCDSPLVYMARESWYIRTTQFREQLIANNEAINWVPNEVKTGRMRDWLENNVDWAISRERFWGTPLPLWLCESCGKVDAIGSVDALRKRGSHVPDDLHKPYIDDVTLTCTCGGKMKRVPEVIDVWFDSGAMPFAQWHYPMKRKADFEGKNGNFETDPKNPTRPFPADFICEAIDQTRGWFYSLLAISTLLTGKAPYQNVVVLEFILDKEGKKMSKHKGNVVNPFETIAKYGADPVRWYLVSASSPSTPTKFDLDALAEVGRKYFDTLRNTYSFFALYANTDNVLERAQHAGTTVGEWLESMAGERTIFDRWIESKLHSLTAEVTRQLDEYDITRPTRAIQHFVIEELSNWYVRLNRRRFWGSGDDPDKFRAYATLHNVLETVCRLSATVSPMMSECYWRGLTGSVAAQSVHGCEFPKSNAMRIDPELQQAMAQVQTAVSLGRAARTCRNLKIRQPLGVMKISTPGSSRYLNGLLGVMADELNMKTVTLAPWDEIEALVRYSAKLNFKNAGPRLGGDVKHVGVAVTNLTSVELAQFAKKGKLTLTSQGGSFELTRDDLDLTMNETDGYAVAAEGQLGVALETTITPELRAEGFARETINKIQTMRKASGLEVTDQIEIKLDTGGILRDALTMHDAFVRNETLATVMTFATLPAPEKPETGNPALWDINGERAVIQVTRVTGPAGQTGTKR